MSQQKKYVKAKDLRDIISCKPLFGSIKKPNLNQEDFGDNLDAYFTEYENYIKEEVKEKPLGKNISFKRLEDIDREVCFVKEFGTAFLIKYKVIISGLTIDNAEKSTRILLDPIYVDEHVDIPVESEFKQAKNGVLFEFRDNNFIGSYNKIINITLGDCANFSFIKNYFEGPDLSVHVKNIGKTLLEFQENDFRKGCVAISVANPKDYALGNWRLKEAVTRQISVVNKLEYLINQDLEKDGNNISTKVSTKIQAKANVHVPDKIKVALEQIEKIASKSVVRISSNKFNLFIINGDGAFHFFGKNLVKQLAIENPWKQGFGFLPEIHWGAHQKLDESESYVLCTLKKLFSILKYFFRNKGLLATLNYLFHHKKLLPSLKYFFTLKRFLNYQKSSAPQYFFAHKKIFTVLKQRAIANNNVMQEIILQREIAKCDHAIVKSEKGWGTYQDKIIFWFSKWISNYGTSWVRPLIWLASLNLIIVVLALCTNSDNDIKMGVAFWKLFNPINSLADMPWPKKNINGWISLLFILQKIILAFTLYEMIKIFRRFGRR